jgi:aminopeptidase N
MRLITIAALIILFVSMPIAGRSEETMQNQIASHFLAVELTPDDNSIWAADNVILTGPASEDFKFTLNKNLLISQIISNGDYVNFETGPYMGEGVGETAESETVQLITAHLPEGATNFNIMYSGKIFDAVSPEKALAHVRGDYTSGMIAPEGVYLSSESGWYPDTANSMAQFEIVTTLPAGYLDVTQGDLVERTQVKPTVTMGTTTGNTGEAPIIRTVPSDTDWSSVSHWKSTFPTDGCTLVANRFMVTSREIDGVKCSTYFFQDDPVLAKAFLDKLEEYLPAYQKLLGKYPYARFDVVENFFSTGYGMPGFTLMGTGALRMPFNTAEGSLAHELVHNWWGNSVFVDWEKGNWCEGLTTFTTNYYWNIINGQDEKAQDYRYLAMMRYSIQVTPDVEYPIREFRTKTKSIDDSIGYDKTCAFFIMLHEMLGKDTFFNGLKELISAKTGQKTTWADIEAAFEKVSGKDLSGYFKTWLDNKGTPNIVTEINRATGEREGTNLLSLRFTQTGELFDSWLPLSVETTNGDKEYATEIGMDPVKLDLTMGGKPLSVTLDPNYYLFRRFSREEIPSCLNLTLNADHILVILPSGGESDMVQVMSMGRGGPSMSEISVKDLMKQLGNDVAEDDPRVTVKYDVDVTEADMANASVLCLGSPKYNSYATKLVAKSDQLGFTEKGFSVKGTEFTDEKQALLASIRNPYNPSYDVTFYLGNSPQAMSRAQLIYHYGWDSYVQYDSGTPGSRGRWDMGKGSFYIQL